MQQLDALLNKYGESHMNTTNKLIHWVCVPSIMFSLFIMLFSIPFFIEQTFFANWAMAILVLALLYYARLSLIMFGGFLVIGLGMIWLISQLYAWTDFNAGRLALWGVIIFVVAWIGQFIGHKIEGKKPSFLQDLQFLLIGPAWLLSFVFKKVGIRY